ASLLVRTVIRGYRFIGIVDNLIYEDGVSLSYSHCTQAILIVDLVTCQFRLPGIIVHPRNNTLDKNTESRFQRQFHPYYTPCTARQSSTVLNYRPLGCCGPLIECRSVFASLESNFAENRSCHEIGPNHSLTRSQLDHGR